LGTTSSSSSRPLQDLAGEIADLHLLDGAVDQEADRVPVAHQVADLPLQGASQAQAGRCPERGPAHIRIVGGQSGAETRLGSLPLFLMPSRYLSPQPTGKKPKKLCTRSRVRYTVRLDLARCRCGTKYRKQIF